MFRFCDVDIIESKQKSNDNKDKQRAFKIQQKRKLFTKKVLLGLKYQQQLELISRKRGVPPGSIPGPLLVLVSSAVNKVVNLHLNVIC